MPSKQSHTSPKDVFLHLLMIGTLYASVISFITLLFQYIDFYFPDPLLDLYYSYGMTGVMRNSIAVLIIVFPVFLFLSRLLQNEFHTHAEKLKSKLRKWLLSFTLFAAAIVIIIDLVMLILHFLEGELTIRFLLKNLTVLVVIGFIFGYFLNALKKEKPDTTKNEKIFIWIVAVLICASVVAGFFIVGSPFQQRLIKLDQQRISDLQGIQYQLVNYYQQKGVLPNSLDMLTDTISGYISPHDPETGTNYEYYKQSELAFLLCVSFKTEYNLPGKKTPFAPDRIYYPQGQFENWAHGTGRTCFPRNIDPELYPIRDLKPVSLK